MWIYDKEGMCLSALGVCTGAFLEIWHYVCVATSSNVSVIHSFSQSISVDINAPKRHALAALQLARLRHAPLREDAHPLALCSIWMCASIDTILMNGTEPI